MTAESSVRRSLVAVLLIVVACCTACSSSTEPGGKPAALIGLPRDLSSAERDVLASSNDFSFALWHEVSAEQPGANLFVSPLSASFSLGMALNGAANGTFDEMRSGLRLGTQSLANIDTGYKSLIAPLTSLDPQVTMSIANSIWYRNTLPVNQPFVTDASTFFGATVKPLDFDDVSGSLSAINGWVNSATKGRIPSIVDDIPHDEVMFLINAIYFKGSWRTRFDPARTEDATFHGASGGQPARLMHRQGIMGYTSTPTYQAVDLAYGDSAFTMTVVLPAAGVSVDAVANAFDANTWSKLAGSIEPADVDVWLPKLTMTWDDSLIPALTALGVHVPFTDNADFTRMSTAGQLLQISSVRQKTFVAIDEEGTEAAAATVTGVVAVAAPLTVTVRVDRPFLFVIRERLSGAILFMGKVENLP